MATGYDYQDGAEASLLDFFRQKPSPSTAEIATFTLQHQDNWPLQYHLDLRRQALLDWFPFPSQKTLLEVGAGCGALTGFFLDQKLKVTALEPSPARAQVLAARFPDSSSHLAIHQKSLQDFTINHSDSRFDFLTLTGVLEYLPDPTLALSQAASLLKPSGLLILAIENRLGLKYWLGAPEDHTDLAYAGLENYPQHPETQTFSRSALITLLEQVGLAHQQFFYPFPDYKLPQFVLSHQALAQNLARPDGGGVPLLSQLLTTGLNPDQIHLTFHPESAAADLALSSSLPEFAPSFLVFASQKPISTSIFSSQK